ncbi:MAG: hypothetical protein RLT87_05100 [Gammaproteobacteria bacterium]
MLSLPLQSFSKQRQGGEARTGKLADTARADTMKISFSFLPYAINRKAMITGSISMQPVNIS